MEEVKNTEEYKTNQDSKNTVQEVNPLEENFDMADLLGPEEKKIEEGEIVKVRIVGKSHDSILVDLGLKSEGIIPKTEFTQDEFNELNVDTEIPIYIEKLHSKEGWPVVSYKHAKEIFAWDKIKNIHKNSVPINGIIKKKIKGGFIVDIGVDAFLPASQLEIYKVKNLNSYIGQKVSFLIMDIDYTKQNIVLSRRKLLEIEQKESRKKTLEIISEGQVLDGIVTRLTDFGAFVEIGGMEGLLHIGDISWQRIKKPEDKLNLRQNIQVKVLKVDREKEQVSLGIKQLTPYPWDNVLQKYSEGKIVKCKIVSKTDFGMFAEIEPGIEGLLHVSEISWTNSTPGLLKNYKIGQEIELKITAIKPEDEKISLSLKRLQTSPWDEAKKLYPQGTRVKGKVKNLTPFGAFVELFDNMEGLLHINDMSWLKKIRHPKDILKSGQEIEVVVLNINSKDEKISLSLKHLTENPFKKYAAGKIVTGKVKRIVDFGAFVELEPGLEALLRISEIGPKKPERISDIIKVGQEIEAKVLKSSDMERKIDISMRKLEVEREKELLKKYSRKDDMPTLGDVLEEGDA